MQQLAAICYVLAEEFDRDPFAIPLWRGRGRDELLTALRAIQPGSRTLRGDGIARVRLAGQAGSGHLVA